jgi:lipopolysaccharide heptosyltransferase II
MHDWNDVNSVLCVRLDTMTGVLMTTPALCALKRSKPNCRLAMLTSASGAQAARLVPEIDTVFRYEALWMRGTSSDRPANAEMQLIEQVRSAGFDAAVIFTRFAQDPLPAAMICYLGGIRRRLAYSRENLCQLLTHPIREIEPGQGVRHEVNRQLDLVANIGCDTPDQRLSLRVPEQVRVGVAMVLEKRGLDDGKPWVLVHPCATAPARRWPSESFAILSRRLVLEHGFRVVFTGAEADRTLVDGIRAAMQAPSESLVGYLDVAHLAGLISMAPLLISNNTAPVHLAAAVGTPVVAIHAMTSPEHTPWQVPNRVVSRDISCKHCFKSICPQGHGDCLRLIAPDEVLAAALDLLGQQRSPARADGPDKKLVSGMHGRVAERAPRARKP